MKISLEQFTELIKNYKQLRDDEECVHQAMKKLSPDFGGFYLCRYTELFDKMLKLLMNDKNEWISWWMYEKEWGTKKKFDCYDKNKKLIPSTTIKDLYNLIKI